MKNYAIACRLWTLQFFQHFLDIQTNNKKKLWDTFKKRASYMDKVY